VNGRAVTGTGFTGPGKRLADSSPGPWKKWRVKDRGRRAIRFIETYCRTPKGKGFGQPLHLAAFQKRWIRASLADGIDVAILQTPRGNGKSSLAGALATWALFDDDEFGAPQVPIVAMTVVQAIRACYGVAVAMIQGEPALANRSILYTGIGQSKVWVPFNGGEMFPVSNDPDGLQGLDPSFAICDEIGFQPQESFDSLRQAQGKRERSLIAGLGTPGLDRDNALYSIRQLVREGAELPGLVFHEYAAPESASIDDRAAWREANPAIAAGFLRETALETDRGLAGHGGVPEGHFRVFRLGQWHHGVDSWLGASGATVWEGLTSPAAFRAEWPVYAGVDIAMKSDTSAVVAMQRRDDGRWHAICRIWRPAKDQPIDITDVMQYLRDLASEYPLEAVSFDPRFFDVPAKMLGDEGLPMVEFPQSLERMTPAYVQLYQAIMTGRITHDGDTAFATQVLNAVPRFSERGFTLEKGKSRGKIDAAVALALAYDQVLRHEQEEPSVYEDRGMVALG
jgi:phage terminase large subunit-like protein